MLGRRQLGVLLVSGLLVGAIALPATGATGDPIAVAGKKCKKKHRHRRKKCKKTPAPVPVPTLVPPAPVPASLSISPTSHDYGTQNTGSGPTFTFVVANTGGGASGVPAISITGTNASQFTATGNTCTAELPPGGSCELAIKFTAANPPGSKSASLNVTANPGGSTSASLTGTTAV